jgi:hypothetical protein
MEPQPPAGTAQITDKMNGKGKVKKKGKSDLGGKIHEKKEGKREGEANGKSNLRINGAQVNPPNQQFSQMDSQPNCHASNGEGG